jgi:transcriptional regulator with XRE-family HTH domain
MTTNEFELMLEGREAARTGRGRELRESAGLSRAELGRLAGVSGPAISRWEHAERTPRAEAAIAYARALRRIAELIEKVHEARV